MFKKKLNCPPKSYLTLISTGLIFTGIGLVDTRKIEIGSFLKTGRTGTSVSQLEIRLFFIPNPGSYYIRKDVQNFKAALSAFLMRQTSQNLYRYLIKNYVECSRISVIL
jgi:hypothetical protein